MGEINRPLDTRDLGPIRVDMNSDRIQAKLVRDALAECAKVASVHESVDVCTSVRVLQTEASDALLAKLRRLLK